MSFNITPEQGSLMSALALGALMLSVILLVTTRGARARAQEKARAWTEIKRPDWEARAQRKREQRASGARARARIRGSLMLAVALVALGATNLSAHGTITMIQRAGLESLDAAISVIVVFEMFLAILGALSYWHMQHGTGFNKYEAGVWAMASLMGAMSWWGAGSLIYALWPLLAAVAWHLVITFGRQHKPSAVVRWLRFRLGRATTRDATALITERLITRIVNHAYYANTAKRALVRAHHERAFDRAWARADELGILTPVVRARIQTRIAARYAGARALAPEAVAHMNPWNERAPQRAHSARTVRPVSAPPAPVVEMSVHEDTDERAQVDEVAPVSAPPADTSALVSAVLDAFAGPDEVRTWVVEFVKTHGKLPTRDALAVPAKKSPGHVARWMMPVRKELGLS